MRFRAIYFVACDLEWVAGFFTEGFLAPEFPLLFELAAAPVCLAGACFADGATLLLRAPVAGDSAVAPFVGAVLRARVVDCEPPTRCLRDTV